VTTVPDTNFADILLAAKIAIGVVAVLQIGIQNFALVDLARHPAGRIRPNKLVCVL
jgi:hypothetical protein